jgi:hypothetical protein
VVQSDDLPPPRRPLLVPVVLATVLLILIGVGAGLALGARHKSDVRANGSNPLPPATFSPSPSPRPTAKPVKTGKPCLEQTQETAQAHGIAGPLSQVLYLKTSTSTVYICQDGDGNLYYHANNTRGGGDWVEGKSAIFIADVVRKGVTYEATADDGVVVSVTTSRLVIRHKDGSTEVQYSSP